MFAISCHIYFWLLLGASIDDWVFYRTVSVFSEIAISLSLLKVYGTLIVSSLDVMKIGRYQHKERVLYWSVFYSSQSYLRRYMIMCECLCLSLLPSGLLIVIGGLVF